jgi:hypothetical protein
MKEATLQLGSVTITNYKVMFCDFSFQEEKKVVGEN